MSAYSWSKRVAVIAVACVFAAMALFATGCGCSKQETPEPESAPASDTAVTTVKVPNVVSLKKADAQKMLMNSGLVLGNVSYDHSDKVPNGHVISQSPEALTEIAPGSSVDVVISKGKHAPVDVVVPNLLGLSQTDAEKALSDANLVAVQDNPVVSTDVDPGKVCKQSVPAGSKAKEGT
ncbi:MAG: PASTA domain-containing protein, partial [Eggerthellaceae bacterium]|nr:PASTA domain-containing protein [Eggerthellaceae bacterium]